MRDQPVAPAIANALIDATGVRFAHLPFTPDRIFARLVAAAMTSNARSGEGVTIVTQTRVRPGNEDAFAQWQKGTSEAIAHFPASFSRR